MGQGRRIEYRNNHNKPLKKAGESGISQLNSNYNKFPILSKVMAIQ